MRWVDEKGTTFSATRLDNLVKQSYLRHGIGWAQLVNDVWGAVCSVDVLFLRREPKTGIVQTGDLDNRIKLLFDALSIPRENEFPDSVDPIKEPTPFFCLLSDDSLITQFRVTADRLLIPNSELPETGTSGGPQSDVYLVIEVKTFIDDQSRADLTYGSVVHA
jgi:hypothetical protein